MAYDATKDKVLASQLAYEGKESDLVVEIACYNGGTPKIGIQRMIQTAKGGHVFVKLGRMTIEEFNDVVRTAQEMLTNRTDEMLLGKEPWSTVGKEKP